MIPAACPGISETDKQRNGTDHDSLVGSRRLVDRFRTHMGEQQYVAD